MKYIALLLLPFFSACSSLSEPLSLQPCVPQTVEKFIEGGSMYPLFSAGSSVVVQMNYYECLHALPQKGDMVTFFYEGKELIKKIVATENESIENRKNILLINGKPVLNSLGEKYLLTEKEQEILKPFFVQKKIPSGTVFVLGDNIDVSFDSRTFGPVFISSLTGKIVKK